VKRKGRGRKKKDEGEDGGGNKRIEPRARTHPAKPTTLGHKIQENPINSKPNTSDSQSPIPRSKNLSPHPPHTSSTPPFAHNEAPPKNSKKRPNL